MNVLRGKVVLKETSAGIPHLIVVVEDVHAARWAEANGADLAGLQVRRPSLEGIYLSFTQTRKESSR
jgi:diaminopimelate epimerase